ncbi:hypothetical protein [Paenibacillus sp. HW567]|uniref:hypothetical protein n=1 Tax=Paenibacillus sp. HW567 TaxID=1034769 RepID=UPI00039F18FF|nr:hypothetical protein [Paenibacillus sp. HW567]
MIEYSVPKRSLERPEAPLGPLSRNKWRFLENNGSPVRKEPTSLLRFLFPRGYGLTHKFSSDAGLATRASATDFCRCYFLNDKWKRLRRPYKDGIRFSEKYMDNL